MENSVENTNENKNEKTFSSITNRVCEGKNSYFKNYFDSNIFNEESVDELFESFEELKNKYDNGSITADQLFSSILRNVRDTRDAMIEIYKTRISWLMTNNKVCSEEHNPELETLTEVCEPKKARLKEQLKDECIKAYLDKYIPEFEKAILSDEFKLKGRYWIFTNEFCEDFMRQALIDEINSRGCQVTQVSPRACKNGLCYTFIAA